MAANGVPLSAIKRLCRDCGRVVLWSDEEGDKRHECELPRFWASAASDR